MRNALLRVVGWPATVLHGDPAIFDRWRWLKRHLRPGPLRTFDAGCGSGAFTLYAAKIGNEAVGVSFDEAKNSLAAARARILGLHNTRFITADLRQLDQLSSSLGEFDQIICCEVIEHIRNDTKLLADLTNLLKNGGRLILTTPYKNGRPIYGDTVSEIEDGGHVRVGYTHEEMIGLFTGAGLEVTVQEYVSGVVTQKIVDIMRRLSPIDDKLAWAATFPLRVFQTVDSALTRATGYPFYFIAMVGVKP